MYNLLIIHDHDRRSSIIPVLRAATWSFFASHLPSHFSYSPKLVKEAIMADINGLMQDSWKTSDCNEAGRKSYLAMWHLLDVLQECLYIFDVRFNLISVFATADKDLQRQADPRSVRFFSSHATGSDDTEVRAKFKILLDDYDKIMTDLVKLLGRF